MRWPWRKKPIRNIGLWQINGPRWWEDGPHRVGQYASRVAEEHPDWLVCYGCGCRYDAADVDESNYHTHHGGDTELPREALLEWLAMCQRERDLIARTLGEMGRRAKNVRTDG